MFSCDVLPVEETKDAFKVTKACLYDQEVNEGEKESRSPTEERVTLNFLICVDG